MITQRRYDIDWLRVIAIGLLLIYHIAIIFQPWAMFFGFIRSEVAMEGLWKPMTMLNVWRIPFLFFVSGMGVYFAIGRRNWRELITERSRRILLPFVFGFFAIAPLHMFIFQGYYNMPLDYYPHVGHLWFLGNIFSYVLLLAPLFFYLKRIAGGRFWKVLSNILSHPVSPLIISVFFIVEVLVVKPQIFEMYAETWHGYFLGLLAFLFGFLLVYSGKAFWETAKKWRWGYLSIAVILYVLRLTVFEMGSPTWLMAVESNFWIFGIFGTGYRYLNKPSKTLSYLSQAAYPVYIVHMFALYGAAYLILPLQIPVILKFISVVALAGLVCYILFEFVIKRIGVLRLFFGLKWEFSKKQKVEVAK